MWSCRIRRWAATPESDACQLVSRVKGSASIRTRLTRLQITHYPIMHCMTCQTVYWCVQVLLANSGTNRFYFLCSGVYGSLGDAMMQSLDYKKERNVVSGPWVEHGNLPAGKPVTWQEDEEHLNASWSVDRFARCPLDGGGAWGVTHSGRAAVWTSWGDGQFEGEPLGFITN